MDLSKLDRITQEEINKLVQQYETINATIRSQLFNASFDELLQNAEDKIKQAAICGVPSDYWEKYKAILIQNYQKE